MVNFSKIKKLYFVGIKGIAMTALAIWAKERGISVTGSDVPEEFPSDEMLRKAGISVLSGFSEKHITRDIDLVIYTGAHNGVENVEVEKAINLGVRVFPHGKALGLAMKGHKQISVAGSHGKTTTAAMIATIFYNPSYAIGCGEIRGLGLPGHYNKYGAYFVAEADEYMTDPTHDKTPRFLWQNPHILVVTNIDYDHPDAYGSLEEVQQAFLTLQKQSSYCVVNIDDPASKPLLEVKHRPRPITYGESENADFRISSIDYAPGETTFHLVHHDEILGEFAIHVPGKHNVFNATAAIVAYMRSDIRGITGGWSNAEHARQRLAVFGGVKRRFEKIAETDGISFYDDYAHHPKEIQATINAARAWYPKHRIITVFQPHTYSRTKALLADFGKAFGGADIAVITDIYSSAREHNTLGINGTTLVSEIKKHHNFVVYAPDQAHVQSFLRSTCQKGDIVIFMGAGNIYQWGKEIVVSMKSL
jgi:UDP-N-acetylmuramate--alanine ligase